jgi:NADH-quinone oxidoreductase subunit F/NADP-reducing hydrogenase subunit HndC
VKINSPEELKRRATAARELLAPPVPRIAVGMSSCGLAAGARSVFEVLQSAVANPGSEYKIVATGCLGFCGAEPLVDITIPGKGRVVYGPVDAASANNMIAAIRVGQFPRESALGHVPTAETEAGAHGLDIPPLSDHPFYKGQVRLVTRNMGLIDPSSLAEYLASDGYQAAAKALFSMSPDEIIDQVKRSGLRGRGGAGFATGAKWEITRNSKAPPKYIIMNGDEGDPGAYMDRSLMEGDPHAIIEGMIIGGYAIGAQTGIMYVRAEYPLAQERLQVAIDQAREAGLLGPNVLGSGFDFELYLVSGAGAFISGEETALISSVEGRIAEPNPRPPYPSEAGLYGQPTCINNVETWANVPLIINRGAGWYAGFGAGKSKGTKLFCLVGDVARPGLVEVPLGTSLAAIVHDIGGGARGGQAVKALQVGGPSGGCIPAEALDLPVDYESLQKMGAIMGSGGLVVLSERSCLVDVARYFLKFTCAESCGKCTPCREGTEYLAHLLEKIAGGNGGAADLARLESISRGVIATSLCGLGQTAPNPVLTSLRYFHQEYQAHVKEQRCPAGVCSALLHFAIDPETCTGCGVCLEVCPASAISGARKEPHRLDEARCIKCKACLDVCRFDAIRVN